MIVSLLYRGVQQARGDRAHVVLYYHAVTDAQSARFRDQMQWLRERTRVIPLAELPDAPPDRSTVCVTFDDAFESIRVNALPVLESLRIPATVFAVCGNLGRSPDWRMKSGDPDVSEIVMTADALASLPADLIAIGSHTMSHPTMAKLAESDARCEATDSKRELEALIGRPVVDFSFPYGEYSERALSAVSSAGYERVFTSDPCVVRAGESVFGRFAVSPDDWPIEFRLKAIGAYGWLRHVRRVKRALHRSPRRTAAPARAVTQT